MPRSYTLKNNPLTPDRVRKACRDQIANLEQDIANAKSAYEFFKQRVEEDSDAVSKNCMIDSLKIIKDNRTAINKFLDLALKSNEIEDSDSSDELDVAGLLKEL